MQRGDRWIWFGDKQTAASNLVMSETMLLSSLLVHSLARCFIFKLKTTTNSPQSVRARRRLTPCSAIQFCKGPTTWSGASGSFAQKFQKCTWRMRPTS